VGRASTRRGLSLGHKCGAFGLVGDSMAVVVDD
jgi:hypothetical protein